MFNQVVRFLWTLFVEEGIKITINTEKSVLHGLGACIILTKSIFKIHRCRDFCKSYVLPNLKRKIRKSYITKSEIIPIEN